MWHCFAKGARGVLVARAIHALVPAGPAGAVLDCSQQSSQPLGHLSRYITNCRRSGCCALFRQGARCVLVTPGILPYAPTGPDFGCSDLFRTNQSTTRTPLQFYSDFQRFKPMWHCFAKGARGVLVARAIHTLVPAGPAGAVLDCSQQSSQPLGHLSRYITNCRRSGCCALFRQGARCVLVTPGILPYAPLGPAFGCSDLFRTNQSTTRTPLQIFLTVC
jgi:hypothetical protein